MSDFSERSRIQRLWSVYFRHGKPTKLLNLIQENFQKTLTSLDDYYNYMSRPTDRIFPDLERLQNFRHNNKMNEFYQAHFSTTVSDDHQQEKQIKIVLCELYEIMVNPSLAVAILSEFDQFLEKEWANEFGEQTIPEYQYSLERASGLYWPVPLNSNAPETLKKNHFLQRHLIAFFKARGYAQSCHKLFDSITEKEFIELISHGDFFTENPMNPNFLLHGKTIHNLMLIIAILAWEKGLLTRGTLTFKNVLKAFGDHRFDMQGRQHLPWIALFDGDCNLAPTFSDPKQGHSLLMIACSQSLRTLSALLRHSFCKSIFKIQDFINWETGQAWTAKEVWNYYISPRYVPEVQRNPDSLLTWLKDRNKISTCIEQIKENPKQRHHLAKL